jgi:hypothetical protein
MTTTIIVDDAMTTSMTRMTTSITPMMSITPTLVVQAGGPVGRGGRGYATLQVNDA